MPAPDSRSRSPDLLAGFGVAVVVALARWRTSRYHEVYSLWPDEPGQLAIARFLGGGVHWTMHNHSTWRPGFATLLAPVHWFTDDPVTVFRTGLHVNAVLGGIAAWLLYRLTRKVTNLGVLAAAASALTATLLPAVLFTTSFWWSEALVQPLFLATVLAVIGFVDTSSFRAGALAAIAACGAFAAHSRMLPLALVVVAAVIVVWRRRRVTTRVAFGVIGVVAVGFVAVTWYSEWIIERVWNRPFERNSYGGVAKQLLKVDDMAVAAAGQVWSQLVVTGGLVGLGTITAVRRALTGDRRWLTILACTAPLVGLSIVFMADRWRSDQIVYERYNDAVVAPLVVLGIATIVGVVGRTVPWRRVLIDAAAVAAVLAATGAVLHGLRDEALSAADSVRQMIIGLLAFLGRPRGIDVASVTLRALGLLAVVAVVVAVATAIRRSRAAVVVFVVFAAILTVGFVRTDEVINGNRNGWRVMAAAQQLDDGTLPRDAPVSFYLKAGSNATSLLMALQFYLPTHQFTIVDDFDRDGLERFVFAPLSATQLADLGAELVWESPWQPVGLWELPG